MTTPAPRPISQLEAVSQEYLSRLAAQEASALVDVARAYQVAARALTDEWQKAYRLLQAAKAAGFDDAYLSGFIWREQRLASMLTNMSAIFEPVGRATGIAIEQSQQRAIALAQQSFTQSMALAMGLDVPAVTATLGLTFPQASFERMVGHLADGSPINNLAARYGQQGPSVVREALLAGVANGESPRVVARRINKALGGMYGNASLMTRTEMLRVYRESTRATYLANTRYVKGWIWSSALDARTCPICWAMHGTKHPLSEPLASHPACRCSMTPDIIPRHLAPMPDPKLGTQAFRELPEAMQRDILGPLAFRAYQQGRFDLPDLVRETYHPQWGAGKAQRSLSSLLGPDGVAALRGRAPKALPKPAPPAPVAKVLKPKGTPVSDGFLLGPLSAKGQIKAVADEVRETVKLIDTVHGDGGLPGVPVSLDRSKTYYGVYGSYRGSTVLPDGRSAMTLKPHYLKISQQDYKSPKAHVRLTFAHETGHYLDQQLIAPRIAGPNSPITGYASNLYTSTHPGVKGWHDAITNSQSYKALQAAKGNGTYDQRYINYSLTNHELFARSYAQYVATKTQDAKMLAELAHIRDPAANVYNMTQWAEDDFSPIAEAFDALFESIGALE